MSDPQAVFLDPPQTRQSSPSVVSFDYARGSGPSPVLVCYDEWPTPEDLAAFVRMFEGSESKPGNVISTPKESLSTLEAAWHEASDTRKETDD
jgi:hypothetical protein